MRVVDIYVPREKTDAACRAVAESGHFHVTGEHGAHTHIHVLVRYDSPDALLENLERYLDLAHAEDSYVVVSEPLSVRPRDEKLAARHARVAARDEIETLAESGSHFRDRSYLVFSLMAALIATAGLLIDNVAVVVGAMVIAPVFRPLVGVGVGMALGRPRMALKALVTLVFTLGAAFATGAVIGWLSPVVRVMGSLENRSVVTMYDLLIALGAGAAAGYSVIRNERSTMIGIVVAASLVPAACASGIGFAADNVPLARASALIVAVTVVAVLIAVVAVLRVEHLRSQVSAERESGRRLSRWTLVVGGGALVLLSIPMSWAFWSDFRDQQQVQVFLDTLALQAENGDSQVRTWQWLDNGRTLVVYTQGEPSPALVDELNLSVQRHFQSSPVKLLFVPILEAVPPGVEPTASR